MLEKEACQSGWAATVQHKNLEEGGLQDGNKMISELKGCHWQDGELCGMSEQM